MEQDLILNFNQKSNKIPLLEARSLRFDKLNKSFLFELSDNYRFFISFYIQRKPPQKENEKIIVKPFNGQIHKLVKMFDQDSIDKYITLTVSGNEELPLMHLINALSIVFRDLRVNVFQNIRAYGFKIIENENTKKYVLDTDLHSDKEILILKSGMTDLFFVEAIGEIEPDFLLEIIEFCYQ